MEARQGPVSVLAVDPGMSGAVVLVGRYRTAVRRDFKHPEDMTRAIEELAPLADAAVIEMVASRPGQGVASMFSFGHATGVMLGALYLSGFSVFDERRKPLVEVIPQKWKSYFWGLIETEDGHEMDGDPLAIHPFDSVGFVKRFHPDGAQFLTRAKDHNTADAILMALWYKITAPGYGSLRERDRKRLGWLIKRFNRRAEKD